MGNRGQCAVLLGCLLGAAACSSGGPPSGRAGHTELPTARPAYAALPTSVVNRSCSPPRSALTRTPQRPGLDPTPTGVTAVWFRGHPNGTSCTEPNTVGDATLAQRLVRDIRDAPPRPPGEYSCPADFGRSVTLYFHYPHRAGAETIRLTLTGCAAIAASDHTMGLEADAVESDLAPMTPPGFSTT